MDEPRTDPRLQEDLGRFIEDAERTAAHKQDLRQGFYSESDAVVPRHHVDDDDYAKHRSGDFPHVHHTMSPDHHHDHHHHKHRHHHHHRKKSKEEPEGDTSEPGPRKIFIVGEEVDDEQKKDVAPGGEEKSAAPSDKENKAPSSTLPKEDEPKKASHQHDHLPRPMTEEALASRRRRGSEMPVSREKKTPTEEDEAKTLAGDDLDNMASHRLSDNRGLRRRKMSHHNAMASVVHIAKADDGEGKMARFPPQTIDHSPHEMFVELDELYVGEDSKFAWQETARWIKYEEDLEEGADRFGKPHVALLSFHSLLDLRRCIEHGVVVLDLKDEDLPSIVTHVVDQLVTSDQLPDTSKGAVIQALLLKHRHVEDSTTFQEKMHELRRGSMKSVASYGSLKSATHSAKMDTIVEVEGTNNNEETKENGTDGIPEITWQIGEPEKEESKEETIAEKQRRTSVTKSALPEQRAAENRKKSVILPAITVPIDHQHKRTFDKGKDINRSFRDRDSKATNSFRSRLASRRQTQILSRIPGGAEATTVLVGSVEFLERPVMAFVRLAKGAYLGNLTEVPLPVRFLFMLMGPPDTNMDYHEIGRSISTLMSNKTFHDIAYRADDREDLLVAINEFLDDSLVLPPGEIEKETLLPVMHMAKRKQIEKKAKLKKLEDAKKPPDVAIEPGTKSDRLSTKEKKQPVIEDNPLERTRRLFGGLVKDVKRRYPQYLSDIKDGLNFQCLGVFFFIFFACLSPAITFGGLLSEKTDKWIGVSEMLIATSILGVIFSVFSAQPITIIGATGPILIFEEALFQICNALGWEFLPTRFWVLAWMSIVAMVVVMFEGTVFVKFFTLFTEEIFAFLISVIFIYEVFKKLYVIFVTHPLNPPIDTIMDNMTAVNSTLNDMFSNSALNATLYNDTSSNDTSGTDGGETQEISTEIINQPNTALLSLLLTLATFSLAYFLKLFRNGKFLGRSARRALGDFGVPISIAVMVLIDYAMREVYTEKLDVPDGLEPTASYKRGWFINPLGMEKPLTWWVALAAAVPGTLIFILIFIETQITSLIINKKERNMKKGTGFHLDIFLIGIFATFSGLFGVPLLGAASVRSISHVSALTTYSRTHAPGEKPKLLGVTEQRLTSFLVHIMIGISTLMGPVLRQVPLAVLFGVFLYMGVASLNGVQLFDRILLFFVPNKHHPDVGYVRHVMTKRMHLFTFIQVICLAALWAVKSTAAALAFPFVLLLTVPLRRFLLPFIFQKDELRHLDRGDDDDEEDSDIEDEDELDFYAQAHRM